MAAPAAAAAPASLERHPQSAGRSIWLRDYQTSSHDAPAGCEEEAAGGGQGPAPPGGVKPSRPWRSAHGGVPTQPASRQRLIYTPAGCLFGDVQQYRQPLLGTAAGGDGVLPLLPLVGRSTAWTRQPQWACIMHVIAARALVPGSPNRIRVQLNKGIARQELDADTHAGSCLRR